MGRDGRMYLPASRDSRKASDTLRRRGLASLEGAGRRVCRLKHFPQIDDLRTTLWRQLLAIAASIGTSVAGESTETLFGLADAESRGTGGIGSLGGHEHNSWSIG